MDFFPSTHFVQTMLKRTGPIFYKKITYCQLNLHYISRDQMFLNILYWILSVHTLPPILSTVVLHIAMVSTEQLKVGLSLSKIYLLLVLLLLLYYCCVLVVLMLWYKISFCYFADLWYLFQFFYFLYLYSWCCFYHLCWCINFCVFCSKHVVVVSEILLWYRFISILIWFTVFFSWLFIFYLCCSFYVF